MYFSLNIIRAIDWKDAEIGRGNAAHIGLGKHPVSAGKFEGKAGRRAILLKRIL